MNFKEVKAVHELNAELQSIKFLQTSISNTSISDVSKYGMFLEQLLDSNEFSFMNSSGLIGKIVELTLANMKDDCDFNSIRTQMIMNENEVTEIMKGKISESESVNSCVQLFMTLND